MRHVLPAVVALLLLAASPARADGPTVRFDTSVGDIDVRLFADDAPNTVATFLRYVASGAYDRSYFHRSVRDYVIQGGGYRLVDGRSAPIDELIADPDPFERSNQRGTLAVARRPGQPGVSTSQWFFNQADNAALDASADNYTVFGRVDDRAGLAVMDAVGDLPIIDGSGGQPGSAFGELPVRDYAGGALTEANFVLVRSIRIVPDPEPAYALPFSLKRSDVAVRRAERGLNVTVRRLPVRTLVVARLGRRLDASVAARRIARLTLPRRAGKLRLLAYPPATAPSRLVLAVK